MKNSHVSSGDIILFHDSFNIGMKPGDCIYMDNNCHLRIGYKDVVMFLSIVNERMHCFVSKTNGTHFYGTLKLYNATGDIGYNSVMLFNVYGGTYMNFKKCDDSLSWANLPLYA